MWGETQQVREEAISSSPAFSSLLLPPNDIATTLELTGAPFSPPLCTAAYVSQPPTGQQHEPNAKCGTRHYLLPAASPLLSTDSNEEPQPCSHWAVPTPACAATALCYSIPSHAHQHGHLRLWEGVWHTL